MDLSSKQALHANELTFDLLLLPMPRVKDTAMGSKTLRSKRALQSP